MYRQEHRAFSYAVLTSIALHGALLWGVSMRPHPPLAELEFPPLVARLVEPPAPAPLAAPPAPPKAQPEKPRPEKPQVRPRPAPAREPVAKAPPAPVVEPAAPVPPAEETLPERAEPVPATPPPVVARSEPSSATADSPPPRAAAPELDPGWVARYRLQLLTAAPAYKRYPRVASENNWEGSVGLRIAFSPSGRIASLDVIRTSGYDVLDQQAQEMFRNAARAVPVPPVLSGKQFSVEVAVNYELRE